jgi:hypothetical protein
MLFPCRCYSVTVDKVAAILRSEFSNTIAMGSSGLEIVRFNRRYYLRHHQLDRYFEFLGEQIVRTIPTDPEKYQSTP